MANQTNNRLIPDGEDDDDEGSSDDDEGGDADEEEEDVAATLREYTECPSMGWCRLRTKFSSCCAYAFVYQL